MADPDPPLDAESRFDGLEVLLVEDNARLRSMMGRTLESLGCSVVMAADAAEAVGLIEAGASCQLLLSDIRMPGAMDGVALAEWVAQRHPDMSILLVTGFTHTANIQFPVLPKPFGLDHLIDAMHRVLAARTTAGR